ncbi:MAG TPA: gliding motility-associated C-terminal domain-containing protein [Cytophagaceae bacterium]|nr:gliding motility-associated C-terminal domain-containing protein [Cytophagaceae bacterium]
MKATHIRAGEITAVRVTNTNYIFTLTIYANLLATARNDNAMLNFGDGTSITSNYNVPDLIVSSDTYRRTYTFNKTFSGNGTFRVSYFETYRNDSIRNIAMGDDFYIETYISVSSSAAPNNPVQLTVPPIDKAVVGQLFVHNPGAYDPDGDSLSYKLIVPRKAPGQNVDGYFTPEATHSFTLNPVTGDLVWDTPIIVGLYNVAFIIEEWKKGANGTYSRVSYVVRDMQIRVIKSNDHPPVVIIPQDTCVLPGNTITKSIKATDPDVTDRLTILAFPNTYFSYPGPQVSTASGTFSWTPQCSDVRQQPYSFVFEAKDGGHVDTLTDYKTWLIYVKGPAPTGLTTIPAGNTIVLNWNPYQCANAEKIEIYRSSCDSVGYKQLSCETRYTGFPGYVKIGEVPATATSFADNNSGSGLTHGIEYCYFIVATFPLPKSGESHASAESCTGLKLDAAILTNVSVQSTSSTAGSIVLNWLDPTESPLAPPYSYNIQRADGVNGIVYTTIASGVTGNTYTDNSLNTLDQAYRYRIELVGGSFSDAASSVYVSNTPGNRQMTLNWGSNVPWNQDSVWLYRSVNGSAYTKLISLNGNPGTYLDNQNLHNCDTVCYYLRVFSSFCDKKLTSAVYDNNSENSCGKPVDTSPPRAPNLAVRGCEGDLSVFTDLLNWEDIDDPSCPNIRNYNVYFSEYEDVDSRIIGTTDNSVLEYLYTNLLTTAGCFQVNAVNKQGVEGTKSTKVCVDDCVYYELPNLITPNGDSLNDYYRPFPVPRGVEIVHFKVYNRWGALVFSVDNDINLNWTGRSKDGQVLSDGVYYYSAEIKYYRRKNRKDEHRMLKGWVQILDNNSPQLNE